jgi:hypothetical protein
MRSDAAAYVVMLGVLTMFDGVINPKILTLYKQEV